jgi:hypothetical protein
MPKFVRRRPLTERIAAYLDPYDFLLWLSEALESSGWEETGQEWAIPIGIVLNLIFMIARSNSQTNLRNYDLVFDDPPTTGFLAWLVS